MQVSYIISKLLNLGIELFNISVELRSGPVQLLDLVFQKIIEGILFSLEGSDLAFIVGFRGFELLFFGLVFDVAVFEFLFVSNCNVSVLINLSFQFGFAINDFVFFIVSHLISFDNKILHLPSSVINYLLQLINLMVEQIELVLVSIF